jgi:hypothetical protein
MEIEMDKVQAVATAVIAWLETHHRAALGIGCFVAGFLVRSVL